MDSLIIDGFKINYIIQVKNNKHTYLRVKPEGYVLITTNKYVSKNQCISFIKDNFISIRNKIENNKKVKKNPLDVLMLKIFNKEYEIKIYLGYKNDVYLGERTLNIVSKINDRTFIERLLYKFEVDLTIKYMNKCYLKYYDRISKDFNIDNLVFKARKKTTQFGSCNPSKRIISLNTVLLKYDYIYFESVFLHEICHLKFPDHSKKFYNLLNKYCSNYNSLRKELNNLYKNS